MVGYEFNMERITASPVITHDVIQFRYPLAASCRQRSDQPGIGESVTSIPAVYIKKLAVPGMVYISSPVPASRGAVDLDAREEPGDYLNIKPLNCEKLTVSHCVTPFSGDEVVRAGMVCLHRSGPIIIHNPSIFFNGLQSNLDALKMREAA